MLVRDPNGIWRAESRLESAETFPASFNPGTKESAKGRGVARMLKYYLRSGTWACRVFPVGISDSLADRAWRRASKVFTKNEIPGVAPGAVLAFRSMGRRIGRTVGMGKD